MLSSDGDDPMAGNTDFSKKQLATILSALDDAPRSPANKGEALRAIGRSAKRLGLTTDDVLATAPGLLDGRLSPAEFRVELQDLVDTASVPGKDAPAEKPTPRAGTKQALMIELLERPEGATVEQIAEATGWQKHTIRGAISGALKKKLGLTVEAARTREVGPIKAGARGSSTVYRILGPATGPQPSKRSGTEPA